jgi:hypothetical protein
MTVLATSRLHASTAQGSWLLRAGLAFVFAYAGISMAISPANYTGYLPESIGDTPWADLLLRGFAVYELLLVVGLLTRRYVAAAAIAAAATVAGIVALNLDAFDVLFRNVAIAAAALSLASERLSGGRTAHGHDAGCPR